LSQQKPKKLIDLQVHSIEFHLIGNRTIEEFQKFISDEAWKQVEGKEVPLTVNSWQMLLDELSEPPVLVFCALKNDFRLQLQSL
jgi:hypothetical protein